LTQKQTEVGKIEREKLAYERELLQLRPLKSQLENFSQATQKQIEEAVRVDYDRSRLQSKLTEVQSERDLARDELGQLNAKHSAVVAQNARLIEQLKALEQESFEIQARIRRGIEVERENENITRSVE
jgi:chromosome segregation ATPase